MKSSPRIALVLSGGGIRAMVFHLGMMKLLAERGLMENIDKLSTVSGGSLLTGLIFQENQMQWPSSELFLTTIYPVLRAKLCQRSLQWGAVRRLLNPFNFRFLLSRANLLALALKKEWKVSGKLGDLPAHPEWSINGTTAENGKRFRFKAKDMGDYTLGYAASDSYPLANAIAVSAAFPGGFGPLVLDAAKLNWIKRKWDAPVESGHITDIGYKKLHLYDGGVYDNLGLEPFFDAGKGKAKHEGICIIVSDAGAPLAPGFSFGNFNPFRLKRVADIMADQAHALRIRTFSTYLQEDTGRGAFIYINAPVSKEVLEISREFAVRFPTTLRRLNIDEFDRLAEYGYVIATQVERQYGLIDSPASNN